jgi:hypothetical protein
MTQKANPNQQPTVKFFRDERHVAGRTAVAVPQLRRVSRHAGHFLADAILIPGSGDVNLNLEIGPSALVGGISRGNAAVVTLWAGTAVLSEQADRDKTRFVAALDDEDEEEDEDDDLDDDDLDEDDDEDLEDEDDEDYDDDDLDDEDEDLDDDDLDDDEDEVDDDE